MRVVFSWASDYMHTVRHYSVQAEFFQIKDLQFLYVFVFPCTLFLIRRVKNQNMTTKIEELHVGICCTS